MMSKLFRLKEWLTVGEAARHLSTVFREQVSEPDVLRLALDGHLTLSAYFVNRAVAKRCCVVPLGQARLLPSLHDTEKVKVPAGVLIDDDRVLEVEKKILALDGVYDLPMIGSEKLSVEHRCQLLAEGVEVTLLNLDGAFVQDGEGTFFQLQDFNPMDGHYAADGLPDDAVLVVRTKVLRDLQERVESESEGIRREIRTRAETTYLNMIGALLKLILDSSPGGKPYSVFKDQTAVIDALIASNEKKQGLSRRTLEDKFAAAKRSLDSN